MKLDVTFTDGDLNNALDFGSDQSLLSMDLTDEIGEGTKDYTQLKNKPQINGVTLTGNKTGTELGLVNAVEGKGLSTNDYTNEDQDKVQNLPSSEEFDGSITTIEKEIDDLEEFKMGLTTESELALSFENGSLDARDGIPTTVDSTIRLRSDYYEIEPDCGYHVTLPSGLTFKWFAYNGTTPETFVDAAPDWITKSTTIQHSNGKYIRLLVAKANNGTIAPSDAAGISVTVYHYTDETLTQSGKAADAEIVGDFLRGVYPQNTIEDVKIALFDDGADNIPVKVLTVGIEPVQDLHGYSNPWPGGAGKNKLDASSATTRERSGVTFTINKNEDGSLASVVANGTSESGYSQCYVDLYRSEDALGSLIAGETYIASINTSAANIHIVGLYKTSSSEYQTLFSPTAVDVTFTLPSDATGVIIRACVANAGTTANNAVGYPMIRLATETDATFEPYSNICPISGWTGMTAVRAGKNLLNITGTSRTVSGLDFTVNKDSDGNVISITVNGQATAASDYTFAQFVGTPGKVYMLSGTPGARNDVFLNTSHGITVNDTDGSGKSFVYPDNTKYINVRIKFNASTIANNLVFKPMIRAASDTDSTFEPFKPIMSISVTFPTDASTVYGGTLTLNPDMTGELTVDRNVVQIPAEYWVYNSSVAMFGARRSATPILANLADSIVGGYDVVCSAYKHFNGTQYADVVNGEFSACLRNYSGQEPYVIVKDTRFTSIEDFRANSGIENVSFEIPLASPQTYHLTASEVSDILTTLHGTNNIWADCGDIQTLTYYKDPTIHYGEVFSEPIEVLNEKVDAVKSEVSATQSMLATVETTSAASKSYAVGDMLVYNNQLYKVASAIPAGAMLTPGTNIVSTTVDSEIRSRNDSIVNDLSRQISEIIDAPGNIIDYNQSNFKQFTNYVGTYTANSDGFTFSKGESTNFQIGLFFPVIVGHTYKLSYHVSSGASVQSYVMRNAAYPNKLSAYIPEYAYNDNYASESGNDYTVTFTAVTNPECVLAFRISYSAPTDFTLTDLICIDLTENVKVKPEALPFATNIQRGSVVVGNGLDISEEGVLSIDSCITQEINEINTDVDLIESVAVQKVYPVNVLDVSSESFGRSTTGQNWNDSLSITYNDNSGFRATISEYLNLRWWYLFETQSGKTYNVSCETSGMNSGCTLKIMRNYNAPAYPDEYSEDYVVATLTDDGNGKYTGSFTANSDQYMFVIYKRYDSRDLTVTNVKCTDQTDIERYEMKIADSGSIGGIRIGSGLSIKENGIMSVDKTANIPTKYNGREFCVFNKCLCIGDSLTQGVFNHNEGGSNQTVVISKYSYPSMLTKMSGVETTNLGNGGYTSEEWYGLHENDDLSGHDVCIISLGTNDAAKGLSSGTTQSWIQSIITKVKSQNKGIKIFVSNLLPAMKYNTQAYIDVNNYIAAVVQVNTDCYLLDMTQYSVCKRGTSYAQEHLTAIGYRQEAEEIMNYIGYIMQGNKTDFRNVQFAGTNYDWDDD